jgi:hypothetical protein
MTALIDSETFNYSHIVSALRLCGAAPEPWRGTGLILLGYSTKLINVTIPDELKLVRFFSAIKLAKEKSILDVLRLTNTLNGKLTHGRSWMPNEDYVSVAYEISFERGITPDQIVMAFHGYDGMLSRVLRVLYQENFASQSDNDDFKVDVKKF